MGYFDFRAAMFERTDDSSVDMNINASGAAKTFRVAAPSNGFWLGGAIRLVIADNSGWKLYNGFAALTSQLSNGVVIRKYNLDTSTAVWTWTIKRNIDLYERFERNAADDFSDSYTSAKFDLSPPGNDVALQVTDKLVYEFIIQDDLSSIARMRAVFLYGA